ncbi:DUF3800 domain-containing protein [Luteibacter yeojuensis]|uniref:DUF3800 domain-containing protein n=1 Tax=Luteibacter yeojuensis TaxID=345309 RepID=A0A0F3KZ23_9GAMM|nr:DUF3800 domain-containing protein [Luteibacter yeojuensis]KJV36187.1 hypothetical protein VI08_05745 [Luteibacter yeojuensis]
MYMMYVDESGDPGLVNSPTSVFALTGLMLHEARWRETMSGILAYRYHMRDRFGLKIREEIHASPLINKPGDLVRIPRNDRLAILRHFLDTIAALPGISITGVVVDKSDKPMHYDPHRKAWEALLQRFDSTLSNARFSGAMPRHERGMVIVDGDQSGRLVSLVRRMRHVNHVPCTHGGASENRPTHHIIEDPVFRDSRHSMMIQAADVAAYFLLQQETPNAYMRKTGGKAYFKRLAPILDPAADGGDVQGLVRL